MPLITEGERHHGLRSSIQSTVVRHYVCLGDGIVHVGSAGRKRTLRRTGDEGFPTLRTKIRMGDLGAASSLGSRMKWLQTRRAG